jgi:hypothetical protein
MGKIKNNVVTKGFSGKFGDDLVFRQVDNKTIFAKRTLTASKPTARQTQVRNKFIEATNYASGAIDNPQASVAYSQMAELQRLKSAYLAAMADFLSEPEISSVFTASYKGQVGDVINIIPKSAYKITEINVRILKADGSVLETGNAMANNARWKYTAKVVNPQPVGSKLVLIAHDRQGKQSTFEQVL